MFVLVRLAGLWLLPRLCFAVARMQMNGFCFLSARMFALMRLAGLFLLARLGSPVALIRLAGPG